VSTSTTGRQFVLRDRSWLLYSHSMRVLLFAAAREVVGREIVELDGVTTVAVLRARLSEMYPALTRVLAQSRVAVDHRFVSDDELVHDGQEVAVIPPVAGG
jgi:molybdopterin converting factor subunit 1